MKITILVPALLLAATTLFGKSDWDKKSLKSIHDDATVFISLNDPVVTENQQNDIVKCYLTAIQALFPDRDAYFSITGKERYNTKVAQLQKCCNPILGRNLKVTNTPDITTPDKNNIVGHWFDGIIDFYLYPSGDVSITYNEDRGIRKGTWTIRGNTLQLLFSRTVHGSKTETYEMKGYFGNEFYYKSESGKNFNYVYRK